ncbi:MAG: Holliday junction branch migration protein RuvA [Polyangiaceae bacterium]
MIGRLTGAIVEEGEGGALVVDVNGVGYEVLAPLGTRGRLAGEAPVTLYVHTHVREDALQLFGFASLEERDAFRVIIGISNVGPKLGLSLLGAVTVAELAIAVARGETGKLTAIPGVGKKTAERLVLELKGKLDPSREPTAPKRPATSAEPARAANHAELLAGALTRMGYRPQEAERAIATLASSRDLEASSLGDLMREALAILVK